LGNDYCARSKWQLNSFHLSALKRKIPWPPRPFCGCDPANALTTAIGDPIPGHVADVGGFAHHMSHQTNCQSIERSSRSRLSKSSSPFPLLTWTWRYGIFPSNALSSPMPSMTRTSNPAEICKKEKWTAPCAVRCYSFQLRPLADDTRSWRPSGLGDVGLEVDSPIDAGSSSELLLLLSPEVLGVVPTSTVVFS